MRRPSFPLAIVFLVAPLFAANNAIPTVNQPLVPSSVRPGRAAFTLRVDGSAFVPGAVVNWNGVPLATKFINRSRLRAAVPSVNVANPGTVNVTVTNPAPGGGTSSAVFFTVTRSTASLTFATSVLDVGLRPATLVAGDFNNDGKTDLVVFNLQQPDSQCYSFGGVGTIQTLLGNGTGGFSTSSTACLPDFEEMAGQPYLVAGDSNGDGKLDLAANWFARGGGGIALFLGDGTGAFAGSGAIDFFDGVGQPLLGDFKGDGELDIAFQCLVTDFPSIEVWSFGGSFISDFGPLGGPDGNPLATGDFNGDGILDLAMGQNAADGPAVTILLGVPGGSFVAAATQPTTTLVSPTWITTGDFNGDGILDLAFADSGSTNLTVLLGNGDGTFTQKTGQPDAGQTTTFITTADLNGDGKLDLVLVDSANAVLIYLGNGDGTFQTALETAAGNGATQLAIGDFNGDGRLDIAVTNSADNTVSLLIQSPAATVSSSSLKFGKVAVGSASNPRRVTLTNSGSAALQLSSIVASGDFAEINNCNAILPIRQSCAIEVVFQPAATGLRTGNITITDNAADSPQVIQLSGTGD